MKTTVKYKLIILLFVLVQANVAYATRKSFAIENGTLGIGLQYSLKAPFYQSGNNNLDVRFGVNFGAKSYNTNINYLNKDIAGFEKYKSTKSVHYSNFITMLLDYHPYNNGFRLTGGVVKNMSNFISKVISNGAEVTIGTTIKDNTTVNVNTNTFHDGVNLYLGLGYGYNVKAKRGLRFNFSIGAVFQNNPQVSVEIVGADKNKFTQADIDTQEQKIKDYYKSGDGKKSSIAKSILPHVALGVELRF